MLKIIMTKDGEGKEIPGKEKQLEFDISLDLNDKLRKNEDFIDTVKKFLNEQKQQPKAYSFHVNLTGKPVLYLHLYN